MIYDFLKLMESKLPWLIKEFEKEFQENNPTLLRMIPVCAKPAEVETRVAYKKKKLRVRRAKNRIFGQLQY